MLCCINRKILNFEEAVTHTRPLHTYNSIDLVKKLRFHQHRLVRGILMDSFKHYLWAACSSSTVLVITVVDVLSSFLYIVAFGRC